MRRVVVADLPSTNKDNYRTGKSRISKKRASGDDPGHKQSLRGGGRSVRWVSSPEQTAPTAMGV